MPEPSSDPATTSTAATADAGRAAPAARAGPAAWIALAVLMVPVFMTAVDMSVLFLAMPTIAADLLPSGTQQLWVLHIGDIVGASLVLTAGRLVDRFGPRRLLLMGMIGYGLASTLAAFAPSVEVLMIGRLLLGASAVTVTPAGAALLRRLFPSARQFSVALALFMAAFSGGMALGPPLGGLLLEHFWWGAIFLFNVPIALGVLCAWWLLPPVPGSGTGRIDLLSIGLSALGIAGIVYGGQELAALGWSAGRALAVVGGVALIAGFIRRQRRLAEPLLDLRLFRSVPFTLALIGIWLVISASAGADFQFAQHLQVVLGFSPLVAGSLLLVPAVLSMVATGAAPVLLRWMRPGAAIGTGALVAVAGAASMLAVVTAGSQAPTGLLIAAAGVFAVGLAPVFAIGTNVILANAPTAQTGAATSVQEVSGSLGNTTGLALGGTVAYLSYAGTMREAMPAGLEESVAQQSTSTIGAARAAAEELPAETAAQLMEAATAAFTAATRDAYLVAVIGGLLLAVLAFWGLRHARVDDEADGQTGEAVDDEAAETDDGTAGQLAGDEAGERLGDDAARAGTARHDGCPPETVGAPR